MVEPRVTTTHLDADPVASRPTEFVERKGLGHPDSLCDGIAEAVSRRLSRYYREEFGQVRHHNTDKVQLVAGASRPAFGSGEVVEPIYVLIAGRATRSYQGRAVPVDDLAVEAARHYVEATVSELPADAIEFESRIGETSPGLAGLTEAGDEARANDTSVGVGYAPLSVTETIVGGLEPVLRKRVDAVGPDVKVMGWRADSTLHLTIAAAMIAGELEDLEAYVDARARVADVAREFAREHTDRQVEVAVNAADDLDAESVYLTVTGTSAEMGDDGNVGRGNRVNGVIAPHRPMSLEAAAGKNPRSHVGKLYNVVADRAARRAHNDLDAYVAIRLLSRIGAPVSTPVAIDVETTASDGEEAAIEDIVADELAAVDDLTEALIAGEVAVF